MKTVFVNSIRYSHVLSSLGMFHFKLFVRENFHLVKKLPSICFSAQCSSYTKKAKTLELLKSASTFPNDAFQQGKYMLLLKCESVCIDENHKLLWKNFQDIQSIIQEDASNQKILLDILIDKETCLFAVDLQLPPEQDVREFEKMIGGKFINGRESLLKLDYKESQYVAQAKGLSYFINTFNFCPKCGNELISNSIGTQKQCQKCPQTHYPYVAPVGIVLLEDVKHGKVLLVHQKRHPPGMYSCIAGFIEPGESLYQSIKREVAEEVGLNIVDIEFCTSQHWAMPSSQLMLACIATVSGENFELDEKEILSAKWVGADILRDAVSQISSWERSASPGETELWIPPSFTASHQMMVAWLKKYHPLSE